MKRQFDRFILTEAITKGGGVITYTADERLPGSVTRPVRLKVFPALSKSDPHGESRFIDEVQLLADLCTRPNIETFYGAGVTDGVPWIALEQASMTVDALSSQTPADPADVARMIEHVARGLAALHGLQPMRLHNRLQPGNILVSEAGRYFKIMELSLAAPPASEPTLSAESVRYAAPELLTAGLGKPGPSTDLYALGHIAYEMALGGKFHRQQFPAVADGATDLRAVSPSRWQAWHHSMQTLVQPAQEVVRGFPAQLGELIAKLMAKPIAGRFTSADEVVAAVCDPQAIQPLAAAPTSVPRPITPSVPGASASPAGFDRRAAAPAAGNPPGRSVGAVPGAAAPSATAGASVGHRYFVKLRQQTSGPYDLATLQRMARQGQISRLHQVSTDQRAWKGAASVEGLF